jgi:hypothetical protein
MSETFEVFPYSIEKLKAIFVEKSMASPYFVEQKLHSRYFEEYFKVISAKTIVVENNYVDRDYLEDFAGYYVRCFEEYRRKCTRLHFFTEAFDDREFKGLLAGTFKTLNQHKLDKAYLGFLVVKPLPQTIIGRTCLATYPSDGDRRHFPITRTYNSNLFGISLTVDTLAFQEQDTVVAACATSALWSVFQGTGKLFQHPIPSPVEITKAASSDVSLETRFLPNNGLTAAQMAHAIRSVNLEPFLVQVHDSYIFKSSLYAYLRGKFPLILGFDLKKVPTTSPFERKDIENMGKHAVAVTGYSLGLPHVEPHPSGFLLRASRIDKIYVHDDQVGPFARMVFDKDNILEDDGEVQVNFLSTSWGGLSSRVIGVPDLILVPLYHKIRIAFDSIHDTVFYLDSLIEELRTSGVFPLEQRLEWDIYLTSVNELKAEILNSNILDGDTRHKLLTREIPRFLWRATAFCADSILIDLLFDATDIKQGRFFICAIEYNKNFSVFLRFLSEIEILRFNPAWKILEWFQKESN